MRIAVVLALVLIASCARGEGPCGTLVEVRFPDAGHRVCAELADDDAERARGLMDRSSLPAGRGMLFVWPAAEARTFHMRDTLIPLDLVVLARGSVEAVIRMEPCRRVPCARYPTPPTRAALEVAAGTLPAGVRPGARAVVEPPHETY